ncbi:serine/threonine-protein kinase [Isosphaeraceae bacterium EP7]
MVRRIEPEPEPINRDERLGEAIETYLELAESGFPPAPDVFASGYPELGDDLREALEGLALVQGLVGEPSGPGHRLEAGRRVAGYRIVRELGRGGMGIVYEAVHVGLDRPVALKVLGATAAPDSTGRRRFLNEARTAAGLHHTHIVPVFDVGQVGGLCYYAMQRIEGSGLDRVIKHLRRDRATAAGSSLGTNHQASTGRGRAAATEHGETNGSADSSPTVSWDGTVTGKTRPSFAGNGPLGRVRDEEDEDDGPPYEPPRGSAYYRWVAGVGRQGAEAIAHAHGRGVIHRDLKPSNLLVDARGTVWVADFGLARRLADPSQTQADSLLGTPRYMSPEQAKIGPIDGRTDVYSLGATLFELLTLRPPFEGQTAAELVNQITDREPPPPRKFDPKIPRDLETIVLKAMAKRPADRYAGATELADDLERYLNTEPVLARRIGLAGRAWRFARRHPAITAVTTVATATVLTVVTVAYWRVVQDRNVAIRAGEETRRERERALDAQAETQVALASVLRFSSEPDRLARGLKSLSEAAKRTGQVAGLLGRLRNEAVEYLALRDIKSTPGLATGPSRGIVFGPRGRVVTLAREGQSVSIWDPEQPLKPLRTHELPGAAATAPGRGPGGNNRPQPPALAAAGRLAAAVWANGRGVRFFDITSGEMAGDLDSQGHEILSVHGSPSGDRIVTVESLDEPGKGNRERDRDRGPGARWGYVVKLWAVGQADEPLATLAEITPQSGPLAPPPLVDFSDDGEVIATATTWGQGIKLWSAKDGEPWASTDGHARPDLETQPSLTALAFGPDGLLAAAGGGTIRLWDTRTMTPLPGVTPRQTFVRNLRFNRDGTLLAVSGFGSEIEVWDPAANVTVASLSATDLVVDLAFAPNGLTLAAAGATETLATWTIVEPAARTRLGGAKPAWSMAFGAGPTLAIAYRDTDARLWSPKDCKVGSGAIARTKLLSLSPAGDGRIVGVDPNSMTLNWYDDPNGPASRTLPLPTGPGDDRDRRKDRDRIPKPGPAPAGAAATEGRPAPAGTRGGRGGGFFIMPMSVTRDGKALALAIVDEVLIWRADSPDVVDRLHRPAVYDRDGQRVAGGQAQRPRFWRQALISTAGDRLYLLDDGSQLHVWDLVGDKAAIASWTSPGDFAEIALSPDGGTLALARRNGDIAIVETRRGEVLVNLPSSAVGLSPVSVAYSPDGRDLAVGTQQGSVQIWRLGTKPTPLLRLPGHRGESRTLAYDAAGRYLAIGGGDKAVDVWDMSRIRSELGGIGLGW